MKLPVFKQFAVFNNLDSSSLRQLCMNSKLEFVPRGQSVFYQGDPSDSFYVLIKGEISMIKKLYEENIKTRKTILDKNRSIISQLLEDDKIKEIFRASDGKCFGEWGVLHGSPRSATCIALNDCYFMTISKEEFELSIGYFSN